MNNDDKELEFIESLYDEANEELKKVYKKQKDARDNLLKEIAMIMLTYTILDGIMSISKNDKDKTYKKISNIILNGHKDVGKNQINIINSILNSTVNKTFDSYSYNAGLKDVRNIIESNFKGKHFSERVWDNENEVSKHLHKQIKQFLNGKINVNQIKKDIEKTFNSNAYNSKRLVETEVNRCSSNAFDRFCKETGVKKVRYNATLDNRSCSDCAQYHDKVFDFDNKIELPRHPLCRCFYTIEDDKKNVSKINNNDIINNNRWLNSNFSSEKKFNRHIEKHLSEYENITKEEYLDIARKLLSAPLSKDVEGFVSEDGFIFKYRKSTNDFAVGRADGKISTLFKPDRRLEYWKEQIKEFKNKER
ncbi:minor capsid protein [Clostridium botulinum]|uniref:minor capsid protein n=1 Tax=Clostridium botulinum TaxID=1491 RepID=UPI003EF315D8